MKTPAKTTRNLTLLLATMAMAALLAALPAWADTTFTVNATTDAPDADTADGVCDSDSQATGNQCTLRAAIGEANALPGDDVVRFDPSVGGTITLGGSELLIDSNLTIEGPGEDELSVSGDRKSRVFRVQGGTVEIGGLTITGGAADGTGSGDAYVACKPEAGFGGGGIHNNGTLTLSDSTISENRAACGGGIGNYGGTLTVSDSTIRGNTANWEGGGGIRNEVGTMRVSDTTITDNTAGGRGGAGGIESRGGTLTVERSTISGNTTNSRGGGIEAYSHPAPASLTITDSTISGNSAGEIGGGVLSATETLTVSNTTITGNTADREGGGIYNVAAPATVSKSTISDNTAGSQGGGIYNLRGDGEGITVSESTISDNTATGDGGGIYNGMLGYGGTLTVERSTISGNTSNSGGGIYSNTYHYEHGLSEKTTITNSTISSNTATSGYGGGFYNSTGLTRIGHSTVTGNTAPPGKGGGVASLGYAEYARTDVLSSIVSGNENTDVDFIEHPDWGDDFAFVNTFVSEGYNLVGDGNATAAFNKNGDQRGVADPRLGSLADNGGPTRTHALLAGSPAIDAVPVGTNGCAADFTADQRGVHRPLGGACDAGSVENFGFGGFYSPVDNPDVLNRAKAGSSIPVKFSLGGDMGLDIFATGTDANNNAFTYPTSSAMRCDSTDPVDAIEETVAAGGGSLSYDPTLDRYTYVWKTQKAWAGTCRQLVVKLDDGTYHRANFKFVR